jgi:hypothetical protein
LVFIGIALTTIEILAVTDQISLPDPPENLLLGPQHTMTQRLFFLTSANNRGNLFAEQWSWLMIIIHQVDSHIQAGPMARIAIYFLKIKYVYL